jgi:sec-independent protein translocase protein TatC
VVDEAGDAGGRMTLIEHLTELRKRIIYCVITIGVCAVVMFFLYDYVLEFLAGPYEEVTRGVTECGGTETQGCDLVVTDPLGPFLVRLKIAGYGGIALSIPLIFWQIWRFVTPALHKHERRYAVAFLVSSVFLFVLGAICAWFTVTKALDFLLNVGGDSLQPFIVADKYLTLVTLMVVAFGVAFEFPLLLIGLLLARVITTAQLRAARRYAAVGITIFAAIITPSQDPFSLMFMVVPMYLFYEIAILVGRVMKR